MDWYLLFLIALAVFITGVSKGGFSGAFGMIAVPLISLSTSPVVAAAIMLPILCIMDLFAIQKFWLRWHKEYVLKCIPAALTGLVLASLTASWISSDFLKIIVGLIAIGFTLHAWPKKSSPKIRKPLGNLTGKFWCALGGFTSFIAHAGGPPLNVYLLRAPLDKTQYVATSALVFTIINYAKIIPYGLMGQLNTQNILLSLSFIPIAYLGVQLGAWLHFRLSNQSFFKFIYLCLFATGLKLIWDGATRFI
ncbi:sulfite exporter TauE/SafE family protein [Marinomonas epiphytica]